MSVSPPAVSNVADPVEPPTKSRTERAGTLLAWLVPPLLIVGVIVALVPIENGRAQDCGTPLAFVATGRADGPLPDVDRPGQKDEPPPRFTESEYRRAAENPCSTRAGTRMAWSALLVGTALVAGLVGLACTLVGRYWPSRTARSAHQSARPGSDDHQHHDDQHQHDHAADRDHNDG